MFSCESLCLKTRSAHETDLEENITGCHSCTFHLTQSSFHEVLCIEKCCNSCQNTWLSHSWNVFLTGFLLYLFLHDLSNKRAERQIKLDSAMDVWQVPMFCPPDPSTCLLTPRSTAHPLEWYYIMWIQWLRYSQFPLSQRLYAKSPTVNGSTVTPTTSWICENRTQQREMLYELCFY